MLKLYNIDARGARQILCNIRNFAENFKKLFLFFTFLKKFQEIKCSPSFIYNLFTASTQLQAGNYRISENVKQLMPKFLKNPQFENLDTKNLTNQNQFRQSLAEKISIHQIHFIKLSQKILEFGQRVAVKHKTSSDGHKNTRISLNDDEKNGIFCREKNVNFVLERK